MASNAGSRRRGRPEVFSPDALTRAAEFSYARRVETRRGAQDLVYRMFATAVIEQYCEAFSEKADVLSWYFSPKRRHTLLTELGRIGRPRSHPNGVLTWSPEDVSHLIAAALEVAEAQPTTKVGVSYLRAARRSSAQPT